MPPFSVGLAQVEDRLRIVRRRLNLLNLQDALYWSGSLVLLAIALLVALALRGQTAMFTLATWAALAAIAVALVAAALRLRDRWQSAEQVVHWADRQAALDDRLATLLTRSPGAGTARFGELLLEQVLAAAPRWDVDVLVPRRFPRSLYALLTALVVLIVTSFFVRPPATPQSAAAAPPAHPRVSDAATGMPEQRSPAQRLDQTARGGAVGSQGSGAGESGELSARPMPGAPGQQSGERMHSSAEPGARTISEQTGHELSQQNAPEGPRSPAGGSEKGEKATDGLPGQLQDAIRQALGAPEAERRDAKGPGGRADADQPPESNKMASKTGSEGTSSPNRQGGADNTKPSGAAGSSGGGAGTTANAGQTAGENAAQLYAAQGGAGMSNIGTQRVAIKLGALSAMAPNQDEPQKQAPPVGELPAGAARGAPPPLSEEQIPDAPLQKADVAPEHETLVRRVFTRE